MNMLPSLFHWMVDASVRASLLSIGVLLFQAALSPVISARARYLLWLPVLIVLMIPILPRSRWSAENLFASRTRAPAPVLAPAIAPEVEVTPAGSEAGSVSSLDWKERAAAIAWAAGTVLSLVGGLLFYSVALRRFMQLAVQPDDSLANMIASLSDELRLRRPPRIILSAAVESAAVTGLVRPLLLLPADFGNAFAGKEARLVLKHELMHLKRFDLQVNALLFVLSTLHWFNPVLWLAAWRVRRDREAACDAQVLASEATDCRGDYGNVLLKAESARCTPWLSIGFVGIFEPGRVLRSRIMAIARYRRPGPFSGIAAGAAILLLAVLGATQAQTTEPSQGAGGAIITVPVLTDADSHGMSTKEYRLGPGFASQIAPGRSGAWNYLSAHGVQFPTGANVIYFPSTGRLIVHDTSANLDLVDAIAKQFPASPAATPAPGSIEEKLGRIVIPTLEFHNATTSEAIDYLRQQSIQLDTAEPEPSRRGVKITVAPGVPSGPRITLSLTNIPLIEGLKYVCQLANLKWAVNPDGVLIAAP